VRASQPWSRSLRCYPINDFSLSETFPCRSTAISCDYLLRGEQRTQGPSLETALHDRVSLSFVIPRACDFLDLSCFLHIQPAVLQAPQQSRHPERSASQIYRKQRALWRGVEGPRRCFVGRWLWELSGHKLQRKITKSQNSERSRGICGSLHRQLISDGRRTLFLVIPTGANPDFLPRYAGQDRVCGFH
jgi:hypothetical protein